jgi:hypothetical protein
VRRFFILGAFLTGACAGAVALAGCPNNTNPAILPITTVDVDIADILSGANLGCGEGVNDVFEYAAVVSLDDADAGDAGSDGDCTPNATGSISGGYAACFSQLVFSNLPVSADGGALPDGGSVVYDVKLFLYNSETYNKIGGASALKAASLFDPGRDGGVTLCDLPSTWKTTCTANEQNDIAVNAACFKVEDAGSGHDATDAKADATDENPLDAPVDAPPDDAEAGETEGAAGG